MKTTFIFRAFIVFSIVMANFTFASPPQRLDTATFQVSGNCGMCKKTIEGSLKGLKGITSDAWNVTTKQMTVVYDPRLVTLVEIHKKIAASGYDTDKVKASDAAYHALHMCCQYKRK